MKKRFLIQGLSFIVICAMYCVACVPQDWIEQRKSEKSYTVDEVDTELSVEIPCRRAWKLTGETDWCTASATEGIGKEYITLSIEANIGQEKRSCTLEAASEDTRHRLIITQHGGETIVLPVVFHVLYNDAQDSLQYADADRLQELLDLANRCYKGDFGGESVGVRFMPAAEAPEGETLTIPGVHYVQQEEYCIDCEMFMSDNSGKYVKHLWNPNQYINVITYQFEQPEADSYILGISHFPYTTSDTYLEGTTHIAYPYISLGNLSYPYSVSLNTAYLYESSMDFTLAHELGHYLGLLHVFSEGEDAEMCIDTDFCDDTPSYNRDDYMAYLSWAGVNLPSHEFFTVSITREACDGEQFRSVNAMDYNYGAQNQFSADQRTRIRHVLRHSPLLPTERNSHIQRSSADEDVLELPIVVKK